MYSDSLNGNIDKSGGSYSLQFALGAVQEMRPIQSGNIFSMLAKSTLYTAATSYTLSGTVTTTGVLSNAAGAFAGRAAQVATVYAVGTSPIPSF